MEIRENLFSNPRPTNAPNYIENKAVNSATGENDAERNTQQIRDGPPGDMRIISTRQ